MWTCCLNTPLRLIHSSSLMFLPLGGDADFARLPLFPVFFPMSHSDERKLSIAHSEIMNNGADVSCWFQSQWGQLMFEGSLFDTDAVRPDWDLRVRTGTAEISDNWADRREQLLNGSVERQKMLEYECQAGSWWLKFIMIAADGWEKTSS